ncbi:MAG TPA: PaaX family transcriptional regulator C-terminal domain-containing protein [Nocardioidaceae bacterium]|jgi:phenylacetic acid degradation operon negative regulatory protein|nr:PaaX family transcriptional regulator C-terminal domain-containing protein [Nocardioidaceae bacterium]
MHARSALFDLYGDHLRARGGRAPVAALVRILAPLGIAAPAVRTAISRMVRQGWLEPVRLDGGPGYRLTGRARKRLDDAAARIYRTRSSTWEGSWDLLVVGPVAHRAARERLRSGLAFLGYAPLSDSTWISPFASPEVEPLVAAEGAALARFAARDDDPRGQTARAWNLDALGAAYTAWLEDAAALVADPPARDGSDEAAFAVRSLLVHEWRKFLFTDPGLPAELLPADWPGHAAAEFFAAEAARLLPAASRFVDACLCPPSAGRPRTDPDHVDEKELNR